MGHDPMYARGIQTKEEFPMEKMKAVVEKTRNMPFNTRQLLYGISVLLTFGVVGRLSMIL